MFNLLWKHVLYANKLKPQIKKPMGLLIPLPIPEAIWKDIAMDFITHFLREEGKTVIMVIVDKFPNFSI